MTKICVICRRKNIPGTSLFEFPTKFGEKLLNKWKSAAGWPLSRIPKSYEAICSNHFTEDQMDVSITGRKLLVNKSHCSPKLNLKPKIAYGEESDDSGDDKTFMRCLKCSKNSSHVKVFKFPTENRLRMVAWKAAAGKHRDWRPTKSVGICENHFGMHQFVNNGVIESGEELKLLPAANPFDFGKCYVCFKHDISRCPNTLDEISKYSDKILLHVFGELK